MHCGVGIRWEHLQPTLSGHVTDRRGQWAEWWLASVSQPCECSASYRVTQRWSGSALVTHSTQATPPWQFATAMPLVRNGVWYCVKYSSLKSFYVLQSHPASIPIHKMKFFGSAVWVRWQQIEKYIWYFAGLSQVFIFQEMCKIWGHSWHFVCSKNQSKRYKVWI